MKRSLSGELPPSPSQNSSLDSKPSESDESRQQQAVATNGGAPTMHTQAANDPALTNPLLGFDVDAELPDWEAFAQMLPHTLPVENPRNALDDETSSVSDDERSTEECSSEDSSSGSFDEDIGKKISDGLVAGHNAVTVRRSSVRELNEILDVCKRHSQAKVLHIVPSFGSSGITLRMQQILSEYFMENHTINEFSIDSNREYLKLTPITYRLLISLFKNRGLKNISIQNFFLKPWSAEERQSLNDSCKNNSNLKILELRHVNGGEQLATLIEGLMENSTLEKLDLKDSRLTGITEPLARLLKSNSGLKYLKISPKSCAEMRDLDVIFRAIRESNTLEILSLDSRFEDEESSNLENLKLLTGHQRLEALRISAMDDMTTEAVKNFSELVKTLPSLTSVKLGCIPMNQKNLISLVEGLQSIPHLEHFEANLLNLYALAADNAERERMFSEFLTELGKCKSLKAIQFDLIPNLNCLIKFLELHPQISEINFPRYPFGMSNQEELIELVKNFSHIEEISFRRQETYDEPTWQFLRELRQALAINQQIQMNIGKASEAMKGLLDRKFMTDEELYFVPMDVTNNLAKAIARHVPPAKAKAIFDELILHAPKPH